MANKSGVLCMFIHTIITLSTVIQTRRKNHYLCWEMCLVRWVTFRELPSPRSSRCLHSTARYGSDDVARRQERPRGPPGGPPRRAMWVFVLLRKLHAKDRSSNYIQRLKVKVSGCRSLIGALSVNIMQLSFLLREPHSSKAAMRRLWTVSSSFK